MWPMGEKVNDMGTVVIEEGTTCGIPPDKGPDMEMAQVTTDVTLLNQ